jgi:hypothetical protein
MTRTDYQFTKPLAGKPLTSPFGDYASARLEKMRKEQEEF